MKNKSRTYNSTRTIVTGLLVKFVTMILTFVSRKVFLQVFTIEYMGVTSLFGSILTMLSLADLGLETAMVFSYYKPLAEGDDDKLAALTQFYRKIYNIIAAVVGALGLAVLPFLRFFVKTELVIPHLEVYYLITLANTVFSYLFIYKSAVVTADQRGYLVKQVVIWFSVIRLALQIVIMYTTRNYFLFCLITIPATLVYNIIIMRVANREYPQINRKVELDREEKNSIYKKIKSVFIYKVSTVALEGTDSIIISALVSTAVVGIYSNYGTVVSNINFLMSIVFSSLTPSIGNLLVKESASHHLRIFSVVQTVSYWVANVATFCLYFLMDDFIALWIGPQYVFDELTKIALLMVFYLNATQQPILAFRNASGLYERLKYIMVITAVINVAVSIVLGMRFGVMGIILATFIAKVCTHVWYEPKLLYKDFFNVKANGYFIKQIINFILLAACIVLFRALPPLFHETGWLVWIAKGFICVIAINIVCLLRFFRTEEFTEIATRVKHIINAKVSG